MRKQRRYIAFLAALIMLLNGGFSLLAAADSSADGLAEYTALGASGEAWTEQGGTDREAAENETVEPPVLDAAGTAQEDALFTVIGPDGTVLSWNQGEMGAEAVYYHNKYDPDQTLTVISREEWTLSDPEGTLREVSSGDGEYTYAMTRPSWEEPCVFTAGDTVMVLYILLPQDFFINIVVYDETWLPLFPELMIPFGYATLTPQEEIRLAVLADGEEGLELLINPLNLIRSDQPFTAFAEDDTHYFTLIPEEGQLTLGIERGRRQSVWVGLTEQVIMYYEWEVDEQKGSHWGLLFDGYNLRSSVMGEVRDSATSSAQSIKNAGSLVRSSDTGVIAVSTHESDSARFYLHPVGFGEATIYLESDEYNFRVTMVVTDWKMPMVSTYQNPAAIELPSGTCSFGAAILPDLEFKGTRSDPFVLPCLTWVGLDWPSSSLNVLSVSKSEGRYISSDPSIVEIIYKNGFEAYLNPILPGTCTITYTEGPYVKEVVVRAEPGALTEVGCTEPGFYTYYGSAHVRSEAVSLEDGLSIVMAIAAETESGAREALDASRFRFSNNGVARVELAGDDLFHLVPVGDGVTTLSYASHTGEHFQLHISVGLPEPVWDFVVRDGNTKLGYRLWDTEQAVVGDRTEREVFFAEVTLTPDQSIHTIALQEIPQDLSIEARDSAVFGLEQRDGALYVVMSPHTAGEYNLTLTATPTGATAPQIWEKRLKASQAIVVEENTVAAINRAIRTAPVVDGYETVILLPKGYIPMDGGTPILLDSPVTLRGQNTILASDIVALYPYEGAKLQDLTIRFDDASLYNSPETRTRYPFAYPKHITIGRKHPLFAVMGDGIIALENCELDGGIGINQCQYGIGVAGSGVILQGTNTMRNFREAGWVVHSEPGPRRYFTGLTFVGNQVAIEVMEWGSVDPYFMRLTESNFLGNSVNIRSDFPVNFSHNYFSGGNDSDLITKSPQYTRQLEAGGSAAYPTLYIEEERLASTELLNFEGQSSIDTTNFGSIDEPVQITVKELGAARVGVEDRSEMLLQWSFLAAEPSGETPLFRPDAYIDEELNLPPDSGISRYQGVSFAHHGPLPMAGAEIRVQKRELFQEETLYLYRLADGVLTPCGEIDNTEEDFYTFFLDQCSDYIITNVVVESSGNGEGDGGNGDGGNGDGGNGDGGNNRGSGSGSADDTKGLRDTAPVSFDDIGDTGNLQEALSPGKHFTVPAEKGEVVSGLGALPATGHAFDNIIPERSYDYSNIPAPTDAQIFSGRKSSNRYVDDAAVSAAFAEPVANQVVIDVGVRTAVSPLAFQLLSENPALTLVLKGDGYEWRFSGKEVRPVTDTFDTAIHLRDSSEEGFVQLSFMQQGVLPGNCTLALEVGSIPQEWGRYNRVHGTYTPCIMDAQWQSNNRLILQLYDLEDYAAFYG